MMSQPKGTLIGTSASSWRDGDTAPPRGVGRARLSSRNGLIAGAALLLAVLSVWSPTKAAASMRPGRSTDLRVLRVNVDDPLSVAMMNESGRTTLATRLIREAAAQMPDDGANAVTAIRVMGAPFAFGRLTEQSRQVIRTSLPYGADAASIYEKSFAAVLTRALDGLRQRYPQTRLSVFGLPYDAGGGPGFDIHAVNARYADVIDRMDAFVSSRSFLLTGADALDDTRIREALPETLRMAGDRPVYVQRNGAWTELSTLNPSATSTSTSTSTSTTSSGVADGDQRIDPAAVASSVSSTGVTVTIRARRDMYSTPKGELLQVGDRGVLANDLHSENRRLFAELITPPVHGRIILRWDGSFAYRPNPGFVGIDRFEYKTYDWRRDPVATAWAVVGVNDNSTGGSGGGGSGGNETGPYLTPGAGWAGHTPQPDPVGRPGDFGYDAKAIARWDVVPFQTFDAEFNVGVVAFHINGIDRVEFAVNGGPWTPVREMRLNPRTNVVEYWATLRASDFPDGPIEVRAIAWPTVGEPRVLAGALTGTTESARGEHSMFLNTNANGTLPSAVRYVSPTGSDSNNGLTEATPKRTISDAIWSLHQAGGAANGGTVYLTAGSHTTDNLGWPKQQATNSNRWLTISAAPGLSPEDVIVTKGTGDVRPGGIRLLRWSNVTLRVDPSQAVYASWQSDARVWYDDLIVDGDDRMRWNGTWNTWTGGTAFAGGKYMTDSTVRNTHGGPEGFLLVRNVDVRAIISDAFSSSSVVINAYVTDMDPGSSSAHPDVLQYSGGSPANLVIYGLTTDPDFNYPNGVQGFFPTGVTAFTDVAVVDCVFDIEPSWSTAFRLAGNASHVFIHRSIFRGNAVWNDNLVAHNVVLDSSSFTSPLPPRAGVTLR